MSNNAPDYENDLVFPPQEIKSQDELSEQRKKGELPFGEYWCKVVGSPYIEQVMSDCMTDEDIVEILDKVPSYEEWQKLKLHDEKATIKLGEVYIENQQLKAIKEKTYNYDYLSECYSKFIKENQQLKGYNEYLRNIIIECEPYIENVCTALNMEKFANGDFSHKSNEVLSKIRNVIGEKK